MFRRALAFAVAVMLFVPVLAQARETGPRLLDGRIPSAQVQTTGSGAITFAGRMVVNGTIPERGSVQITDRAGDATAHLGGEALKFNRRGQDQRAARLGDPVRDRLQRAGGGAGRRLDVRRRRQRTRPFPGHGHLPAELRPADGLDAGMDPHRTLLHFRAKEDTDVRNLRPAAGAAARLTRWAA